MKLKRKSKLPSTVKNEIIADYNRFIETTKNRPPQEASLKGFQSKGQTVARLQKEFHQLGRSAKKRVKAKVDMHPHWLLIREISQDLRRLYYNANRQNEGAKQRIIKYFNSSKFKEGESLDDLVKGRRKAISSIISEYAAFLKMTKYIKENVKITKTQAVRNAKKYFESIFSEKVTLDPARAECFRRVKKEFFNRKDVSKIYAKANALEYFKSLEKEYNSNHEDIEKEEM
ncbi:hypothetical protein EHQ52_03985 [Leptospira koniambonensis]|uniref:Uncharacterized protein n=1 Tax=Leptospira koniambonensis TaxID=2484950 RepID=A0A4R9JBB5_9LEPT|nr:hypothetical protein [Leptospira koniambonensis]TGL35935.1 hypothetical protein EHQ52_03985 [Leptospira koniambonensis]